MQMQIHILIDNTPGTNFSTEFGISYLIKYNGQQILFDTAQTDLFLTNAKQMGLDIKSVSNIVLSHGHFDHGDGLGHLNGGKLICHPGCFVKRYRKTDHSYIGLKLSREELTARFNLTETTKPFEIVEGAYFLGEIPRVTDFESRTTPMVLEDGSPDFIMDDSALALKCPDGLVVVTGCGHSGIVNTLEHAKKVTGENRIFGIIGGFHLKENNRQTQETITYLKENKVKHIHPSHCTALPALVEFYKHFGIREVKVGDVIRF